MTFRNAVSRLSELIVDLLKTGDAPNARWELQSGANANTLQGFSGATATSTAGAAEISPSEVSTYQNPHSAGLLIASPTLDKGAGVPTDQALLELFVAVAPLIVGSNIQAIANAIFLNGKNAGNPGAGAAEMRADKATVSATAAGQAAFASSWLKVFGGDATTPDTIDLTAANGIGLNGPVIVGAGNELTVHGQPVVESNVASQLIQRGTAVVQIPASTQTSGLSGLITFPVPYSVAPVVIASALINAPIEGHVGSLTATQMQVRASWTDGLATHGATNVTVHWIAIGTP